MTEDVHFKLGERLNENPVKMLLVEPFLNILREFYTVEHATLGAEFPLGSHTAAELAEKLNRDVKELTDLLEEMADRGLMYAFKTEDGQNMYSLTPFAPGVVEFQLMRGNDTPHDRKVARMIDDFIEGEMADLMSSVLQDPEVAREMIPNPPARTITVEKELPTGSEIYPYEKLSELLDKEESFAAAKCYCRHHTYLIDQPCKVEGVPEYSCMMLGKVADFIVDRGFGKRISKEEAKEIIRATEEAGLIHNVNNFLENTAFVCNCCGCCCGFIKSLKMFNSKVMLAYSNFEVSIDAESCAACGDCIDRCQMMALSMEDDVAVVDLDKCVGCGNCVTVCPTESLSMVRRTSIEPPESGASLLGV